MPGYLYYRDWLAAKRWFSARNTGCRLRRLEGETNCDTHGLNGDILVWNHVTQRRNELSSTGVLNADTLRRQLDMSNLLDYLCFLYHQGIINNEISLPIGGGMGQSRTITLLLRKAHLGEVSVTVWPKILKEMCATKSIFVLE